MTTALDYVSAGDPFRPDARVWNRFVQAAEFAERGGNTTAPGIQAVLESVSIPVLNASGAPRSRGAVLGLDAPLVDPAADLDRFLERPAFRGVAPAIADHLNRWAVLSEPAFVDGVAMAVVSGIAMAQVEMLSTDATERQFAEIIDADADKLIAGSSGSARILWAEAGLGVVWALLRIGDTAGEFISGTIAAVNGLSVDTPANLTYDVSGPGFSLAAAKPAIRPLSEGGVGKLQSAQVGSVCCCRRSGDVVELWQARETLYDQTCVPS